MDTSYMEGIRTADPGTLVAHWRRAFPILRTRVHGKPLVYLDNAATTQKPQAVIDAIGLGAAVDFVSAIGLAAIAAHEQRLLNHAGAAIGRTPGVRIVGTARHKASILSFVMDGVHPHDIGSILDIAFAGVSCAIAKASASLMTEAMMGSDAARGRALLHKFEQMVGSAGTEPDPELGELRAFADVRDFPSRVQCAMLSWDALRSVLLAET